MVQYVNFSLYQTGWFAIVVSAAYSQSWWGITIAMSLVGVHMLLTSDRTNQAKILLVGAGVGFVVDSTLHSFQVYRFPNETATAWLPPLWMSVLWIQFATTFRYCLKWLGERYVLTALLGFAGAPLAFLGGESVGAVSFCSPRLTNLLVLGSLWAIAIPLLIYVSDRIHADASVDATYRGFPSPKSTDQRASPKTSAISNLNDVAIPRTLRPRPVRRRPLAEVNACWTIALLEANLERIPRAML